MKRLWFGVPLVFAMACSLTTDLSDFSNGKDDPPDGASPATDATTPADDSASGTDAGPDAPTIAPKGWGYRKSITVDKTKLTGTTDLVDFPLLVSVTDDLLKSANVGGKVVTGTDIAFVAVDGVTLLPFEVEQYASAQGRLVAWVKVPALSPTNGTKIYLTFGNPDVKTSLENRAAVWSASFSGVWHMNDSTWTDSLAGLKSVAFGGATTSIDGKIAGGGVFGKTDVFVEVEATTKLRPTSITVSAWAKPQSVGSAPDRHPYMVWQDTWRSAGSNPRGYYMEIYRTQTQPTPTFYTANATAMAHAFATTSVVNGTWYYVVGTRDEVSGITRIYVDGKEEGTATMTGGIAYQDNAVRLGGTGSETWDGLLDEVRVSKVARSSDWIRAEYENQKAPESFVGVGPLETLTP